MKYNPRKICEKLLQQQPMERIIRISEMTQLLGIDRTTLHRRVKNKTFITPIKVKNRTIGWSESSYKTWIGAAK